jgi:tRNA U34 5-carboxymethylaminomethyl modifying enzyme MnmG/GidA
MPEELQEAMLRTVPGLENVKMARPAYGVEYDFVDPRELARTSCYRLSMPWPTSLSCSNA